jgi:hypothetical protein
MNEIDNGRKQMHSYLKNTKSINKRDTDLIHASLRELGEFIAFEPKFKAENIARACARTDPKYAVKGVASKVRKASTEHLKGITSVIRYCHIPLRILIQAPEKSQKLQDKPLMSPGASTTASNSLTKLAMPQPSPKTAGPTAPKRQTLIPSSLEPSSQR